MSCSDDGSDGGDGGGGGSDVWMRERKGNVSPEKSLSPFIVRQMELHAQTRIPRVLPSWNTCTFPRIWTRMPVHPRP